jgi:hypothetical protein
MAPPSVQRVVKPSGKVYFYYAPKRGTLDAGRSSVKALLARYSAISFDGVPSRAVSSVLAACKRRQNSGSVESLPSGMRLPLTAAQMAEIRSWEVRDLEFFIATQRGKRFVVRYLDSVWREWRASAEAATIRDLRMTIHGLRATKISDLRKIGTEDGAISDEVGISVKMVSRYLRFDDKAASARASRDRRERKVAKFENSKAV